MNTYYPIRGFGDVSGMMRDHVMARARQCLARTAAQKEALSTVAEVKKRQQEMRRAFFDAIGGAIPPRSGQLNPVWGPLRDRGGYSVQNVMFSAAPDVYVTATVWRPVGREGGLPGLLFPCGHTEYPRESPPYQEVCAWFAANGYVALAFDPPGQGEQKICWDPVLGASFAGSGSAEHQHCGLQCELVGHNIARYFIQLGMAAFDLLAGLPEVDAARIAVTGYSGGGTQSSYLMLADERIAAGMPCIFTTAREVYMQRPHWHDEEQNLTGSLLAGLDYDDFYFCFAPKPAAIGAATGDFFPIEGARLAYERARRVYALFGAEDRIAMFEAEGTHNFHPVLRNGSITFFNRFLQPQAEFRELAGFQPEPPESQRNTTTGQICTSIPGAKLVFEQHIEAVAQSRSHRHVPTRAELAAILGLPASPCPLNPRILETREEDGVVVEKGFIATEPDIVAPALRLSNAQPHAALVYCSDGGTQGVDALEEKLLRGMVAQGTAVILVEPRGIGETKPPTAPDMLNDIWIPQHLRMLGTSVGALRAYDILRAIEFVRTKHKNLPLTIMAKGMIAWSAVLAAALDGDITALCLQEIRPTIEEFAVERTARIPQAYAMPGILRLADIPLLVQAAKVSKVLVVEPVDSLGRHISEGIWRENYATTWAAAAKDLRVRCRIDSLRRHAEIADFVL